MAVASALHRLTEVRCVSPVILLFPADDLLLFIRMNPRASPVIAGSPVDTHASAVCVVDVNARTEQSALPWHIKS